MLPAYVQVTKALPSVLFIPEETDILDYATVKPLQDNWPTNPKGIHAVSAAALYMWPKASNFQLMQFGLSHNTAADFAPLVKAGDTLRMDAWYNSSDSWNIVREAYIEAALS